MKRRLFSVLLAISMLMALLPAASLAEEAPVVLKPVEQIAQTPAVDGESEQKDEEPGLPTESFPQAEEEEQPGVQLQPVQPGEAYLTVTFQDKDGGEISSVVVKNGESVNAPAAPEVSGSKFVGWYEGETKVSFPYTVNITQNTEMTVKARYEAALYVFFYNHDGNVVATKEGKKGDVISVGDVTFPVEDNEALVGWFTDAALTEQVNSVTLEDSNINLYAKVAQGYWITFESNGGSYVEPAFYAAGTAAQEPDDPKRSGFVFEGWFTDVDLAKPADFAQITAAATVYAKWTKANTRYTVIHFQENADDDGYSFKESENKLGVTGETTAARAKKYNGFTAQTITQETIKGDGSTIVKVYYKRNVYTVKFYNRKGTSEYTQYRITAKYGQNISDKWPGGGWFVARNDSKAQSNIDVMPLGGTNFYGRQDGEWEQTASYYLESLSGKYELDHKDTAYSSGTLTVTSEDKYPITGFTYDRGTSNGARYDGAKFYYKRNSYNVVFINNGVTDKTISRKYQQDLSDVNYTPTAPADKSDYIFGGWYDNELGEGAPYVFAGKTMPAQNVTVYAKWIAPTYTVTFIDADGKTTLGTQQVEKNGQIDVSSTPTPTMEEGDQFIGWMLENGNPFNMATRINRNYTLYAKVGNENTYTLTYDANGGTGSVPTDANQYVKNAYAQVMSGSSLTKNGMVFLGWSKDKNAISPAYHPGGSVRIDGDTILYAVWGTPTGKEHITYHSNFGTGVTRNGAEVPTNSLVTVDGYTGLPDRPGYEFAGWNTAADGKGSSYAVGSSVRLTADSVHDLYAQWIQTKFTLTVKYVYAGGGTALPDYVENDLVQGATYSVDSPAIPGYAADKAAVSGVMPAENVTETVTYTKRSDLSYTINYYWNGTDTKVKESRTVNGQTFGASVTEAPETVEGYTPVTGGTETIIIGVEKNEINFYYYKNVTLNANSGVFTYDGRRHTVSGYTCDVEGVTFAGITATRTEAITGSYPVSFEENPVGRIDETQKYIVTEANPGTLVIAATEDEVVVIIRGHADTKVYNNEEYTVTGYDVSINNPLYTTDDITFSGKAEAKRTRFGRTEMGLKAEDFTNNNRNFTNVTFVVEDGYIDITRRALTLIGQSDTLPYTGSPISLNDFEIEGLATGDSIDRQSISYLATGTLPNEYPGAFTGSLRVFSGESDVSDCYKVTMHPGKLTITKAEETVVVKITGNTRVVGYNGQEQSVEGFTTDVGDRLINVTLKEGSKAEAKGTLPNRYSMGLTADDFDITSNVYENIEIVLEDGWLQIEPSEEEIIVTITGNRRTVTYNGQEQSVEGFTTDVGDKPITVTLQEGLKAEARGKEVNRYPMHLTERCFVVESAVYKNIRVIVNDGYLDIQPVYNPPVYPDYDPTPAPSYVPAPDVSPKTGDESRIALWLTLMGLSAAAIAGVIVFDKKRRRS